VTARPLWLAALLAVAALSCSAQADRAALTAQVFAAERAFAKTMADRDHAAFTALVAEDSVFFGGPQPLRGRAAVAAGWKAFFDKPEAPFSWEPDEVEVLDSGQWAHSSGPVRNPKGEVVNRFNSVWHQEAPGVWRVVFDRGDTPCNCQKR
jgi:ketosteroid isomerase-like protein